jgi:hypothetical protein
VRAVTAAQLYLGKPVTLPSLAAAAEACGSNCPYVKAAITLLNSEDADLINRVLTGEVGLLDAAAAVEKRAQLIAAYREAHVGDLAALGKAVGPGDVWDHVIVPSI